VKCRERVRACVSRAVRPSGLVPELRLLIRTLSLPHARAGPLLRSACLPSEAFRRCLRSEESRARSATQDLPKPRVPLSASLSLLLANRYRSTLVLPANRPVPSQAGGREGLHLSLAVRSTPRSPDVNFLARRIVFFLRALALAGHNLCLRSCSCVEEKSPTWRAVRPWTSPSPTRVGRDPASELTLRAPTCSLDLALPCSFSPFTHTTHTHRLSSMSAASATTKTNTANSAPAASGSTRESLIDGNTTAAGGSRGGAPERESCLHLSLREDTLPKPS